MGFQKPNFSQEGSVELRFENGEVCIYASPAGLRKLAQLCEDLSQGGKETHLHLGDRGLLTEKSLKGVIALFR